jgi:hypothetical protein
MPPFKKYLSPNCERCHHFLSFHAKRPPFGPCSIKKSVLRDDGLTDIAACDCPGYVGKTSFQRGAAKVGAKDG